MSIRIGTWNAQYGVGADKNARRLAALDEQDADVWVLTETNDQLDLSDRYQPVHDARRYPPGDDDGSRCGPGCRSCRPTRPRTCCVLS